MCLADMTCSSCIDGYIYDNILLTCDNFENCTSSEFFDTNNLTCVSCPVECATCSSLSICLTCLPTFSLVSQLCVCDSAVGMFLSV